MPPQIERASVIQMGDRCSANHQDQCLTSLPSQLVPQFPNWGKITNSAIMTREEGWDKKKDAEGGREFWAGGKKRELLSFVIKSLFSSKQPDLSPAGLNKCCLMDWQS